MFAPGTDVSDGGFDLQRNHDLELRRKRPREQEFMETKDTHSQISSFDFLWPRSVSTLDNVRLATSG